MAKPENARSTPACQCAISGRTLLHSPIRANTYKRGAKVHWPVKSSKPSVAARGDVSAVQSSRSRRRAAFSAGNAETDWLFMVTLTYDHDADRETALRDIIRFRKRMVRMGNEHWFWFREFTLRGRVHFHWFIGADELGLELLGEPHTEHKRIGAAARIPSGPIGKAVVEHWMAIARRPGSLPAFDNFQRGGIIEALRSPDAAGRYVAKEAGKRIQKVAPPGWEKPGRWWAMAPKIVPIPRRSLVVVRWPVNQPCLSSVWDKEALRDLLSARTPLDAPGTAHPAKQDLTLPGR